MRGRMPLYKMTVEKHNQHRNKFKFFINILAVLHTTFTKKIAFAIKGMEEEISQISKAIEQVNETVV